MHHESKCGSRESRREIERWPKASERASARGSDADLSMKTRSMSIASLAAAAALSREQHFPRGHRASAHCCRQQHAAGRELGFALHTAHSAMQSEQVARLGQISARFFLFFFSFFSRSKIEVTLTWCAKFRGLRTPLMDHQCRAIRVI